MIKMPRIEPVGDLEVIPMQAKILSLFADFFELISFSFHRVLKNNLSLLHYLWKDLICLQPPKKNAKTTFFSAVLANQINLFYLKKTCR